MKLKEYPLSLITSLYLRFFIKQTAEKEKIDCIISLTSIPSRLPTLHLTIASLLNQSTPPKKIILWLNHELKDYIPTSLSNLESDQFTICFRGETSSHRKLIFALQEFKNDVIVTCDDDVMYRKNWLETLMGDHKNEPGSIICHECREINFDQNGEPNPYRQWPTIKQVGYSSPALVPIGYGGVLYPPESLHQDTVNKSLYLSLAPKADDLWFKAMGLIQGTSVIKCSSVCKKPIPIIGAKGSSLAQTNIKQDGNRQQWLAICNHYNITSKMLNL